MRVNLGRPYCCSSGLFPGSATKVTAGGGRLHKAAVFQGKPPTLSISSPPSIHSPINVDMTLFYTRREGEGMGKVCALSFDTV